MGLLEEKPNKNSNHIIQTEPNFYHKIKLSIEKIFWLDLEANNEENSYYQSEFLSKFENIEIKTFKSIESLKNTLLKINFESVFILISGKFFRDFPLILKDIEKDLLCYPIVILFTSEKVKKVIKNKEKDPKIKFDEFIFDIINHPFYNAGGIFTDFDDLYNYLASFKINITIKESEKTMKELDYNKAICFQKIESEKDLILPLLYKELESNIKITNKEINDFHKFISHYFYKKDFNNLLFPLMNINKKNNSQLSLNILSKFWAKIYSFEYPFYKTLNNYLMNNDYEKLKDFYIFIKMMYTGLKIESLKPFYNNIIFRGCVLNTEEIEKLEKNKNYNKNNYPKELLYSRSFLSFSEEYQTAEIYIKENFEKIEKNNKKNLVLVLFIIESLNKKKELNI